MEQTYADIAKSIANGVKWNPEYAKRHDGLYNVWRPVIHVHVNKCCDIYWEIYDVVGNEKEARNLVRKLRS